MFDPGPCVYMEKMAGSPEVADLLDLDRPLAETVKLVAERKGSPVGDVMVVVLDRPQARAGHPRDSRCRRARAPDRPRRRVGVAAGCHRALYGRSAVGHRRDAGGGHLGCSREVPRRAAARPAVAARRCGAPGGARRGLRPAARAHAATTWWPGRTCSSPRRGSPTATCCRACATRARGGATTESLVMRTRVGHDPPHPGHATTVPSCGRSAASASEPGALRARPVRAVSCCNNAPMSFAVTAG